MNVIFMLSQLCNSRETTLLAFSGFHLGLSHPFATMSLLAFGLVESLAYSHLLFSLHVVVALPQLELP